MALRALGGPYLPWSSDALRPAAAMRVIDEIALTGARTILELGSGVSTVLIARFLRQVGEGGRLVSVEDDPAWAAQVERQLEREELLGWVEVVVAESTPWTPPSSRDGSAETGEWRFPVPERWYDARPIHRALDEDSVDFLLVDGPRGRGTISRYPALIELLPTLHDDVTVVLDDVKRPGEAETLRRWSAVTDFEFWPARHRLAFGRRIRPSSAR